MALDNALQVYITSDSSETVSYIYVRPRSLNSSEGVVIPLLIVVLNSKRPILFDADNRKHSFISNFLLFTYSRLACQSELSSWSQAALGEVVAPCYQQVDNKVSQLHAMQSKL